MYQPKATQFATTVAQKMVQNGCLTVLCLKACRATNAPGQPPSSAIKWIVDSEVR